MDVADSQVFGRGPQLKSEIFKIMPFTDFGQFSCTAYQADVDPNAFSSLEDAHNTVHDFVGTSQTQQTPTGNMTDVWASSFDPIFWLHHTNIDRLAAIWQAIHPNSVIDTLQANRDRYTESASTLGDNGASHLEPWHQTDKHSMADYYTAESVQEVSSTFLLGYYYPETPLNLLTEPTEMQAFATKAYRSLYQPTIPQFSFVKQSKRAQIPLQQKIQVPLNAPGKAPPAQATHDPEASHKPAEADKLASAHNGDDHLKPQIHLDWQAFVRVNRFALNGTWGVHIFLGDVPANSDEWVKSDNLAGTVVILAPQNRDFCQNCQGQANRNIQVTRAVDLNHALQKKFGDVTDEEEIVQHLKENISWRVAKVCLSFFCSTFALEDL